MQSQYVINREQMYQLDKRTMNEFAIESQVLMEIAGLNSTQQITNLFPIENYRFLIMCADGNNSGDGFVIARWLLNMTANVEILFIGNTQKMSPETYKNYQLCQKLNITFIDPEGLDYRLLPPNTVIIDSLLGIGFKGHLREPLLSIITQVNSLKNPRIAIDIPSGVDADSGEVKTAFKADYTMTMAAVKQGMLLNNAPSYCGKIQVIDISIPDEYYQKLDFYAIINQKMNYPQRFQHSHKGDYGKVLIVAGSESFSGAAILCSKACVKAGAGLIKLLHPKGLEDIFESQLTEVMTKGVSSETNIGDYLLWADTVLIGPGLGQSKDAEHILINVLKHFEKTIVIDADGLNLLAKNRQLLLRTKAKILLTPHLGEFSRLSGVPLAELMKDLIKYAKDFIKDFPVALLVKSSKTLYIDSQKAIFNVTGNDGLSTGGSGDILAGIIASFIGQHLPIDQAAINASYYLGKLVEKMSNDQASFSIIPSEIIKSIGKYDIR